MHNDLALIEQRVRRALERRLRPAIEGATTPLTVAAWDAPREATFADARAAERRYRPVAVGEPWGAPWSTTWFALTGTVPTAWAGETVEAILDLGWHLGGPGFSAEGLVYDADGRELKGLASGNPWVPVGQEQVALWVQAAANARIEGEAPALGDPATAGDTPLYRLTRAELAVRRADVAALVTDTEVLLGLAAQLAGDDARRATILRALERMLDRLALADLGSSDDVSSAHRELADVLAAPAVASAHRISAIGNAHIDTAWLWPLTETRRKVARTVANALALMETEADYVFAFSQAQQLDWLRDDYPALYARLREAVAAGRIVPVGGVWVEPDGNLPGGEAMVRQLVYGKRFFLHEFGIETREVWMPDSFGYSAALPQLAALAGNRYMLTQKLSWNDTDRFPHHTFWWEGIDGTRLFTHFPPVDTYTASMTPAELIHAARGFAEQGRATRSLVPFGYGDGGGGPTREMLAAIRTQGDLEGLPRVAIETPEAFFDAALAEYRDAPVWSGELYLERHRGTFTTQADAKAANRRGEHLLHEAELWAATASVRAGAAYPGAELERLYKDLCLLQFHDILPGSSIAWVYDETAALYATIEAGAEAIITDALAVLAGPGSARVVFNAAPHARDGVPALGAGTASAAQPARLDEPDAAGAHTLTNGLVQATVDAAGLIVSLRDLESGREAIAPGDTGNRLVLHPDTPNDWEAWDIDRFYRNVAVQLTDGEVTREGSAVRVRRRFGDSTVDQVISLSAGDRALTVDTEIDWHEHERLLKVAWPFDVHAAVATSEIQFGHIQRPTHTNTSWDAARFESFNHRFIHVGEPGFGVAITTTATYGHDATRTTRSGGGTTTTVRLSLLRGPRYPDPEADQGVHRFRWRIHPGASVADAVREGYRTNLPPRIVTGGNEVAPLVSVTGAGAVIETVKLADDGSGDVIVRAYESLGGRSDGALRVDFDATAVTEVDLLERSLQPTGALGPLADDGSAVLTLRPFQVLTLRIARGAGA